MISISGFGFITKAIVHKSSICHLDRVLRLRSRQATLEMTLDSDPLQDIKVLQNISFVMKEGIVYKIENEMVPVISPEKN